MKLSDYIKINGRPALARLLGTSPAYISQLAHGHRKPSPRFALAIEHATHGTVSRYELRLHIPELSAP